MPIWKEDDLRAQLKEGRLCRVYWITGEDDYLKQHYVDQLVKAALGDAANDFNYHRIAGRELTVDVLLDAAQQLPWMSAHTCVCVDDWDVGALSDGDHAQLLSLLDDPPESAVIIFWFSALTPSGRSAKVKAVLDRIQKNGAVIKLDHRDAAALAKLLVSGAKRRGADLPAPLARLLVERCGSDLNLLTGELDKLCAYAAGRTVTEEDIDRLAVRTLDSSAYDLVRAIERRQPDRAFGLLDELFAQKAEPVVILGAMAHSAVQMYRAKAAVAAGVSLSELAARLELKNPASLKYAANDAARLSMDQLRQMLAILDRADSLLKSSPVDQRVALEQTVTELLMATRPGGAV